jgi:DNA-binding cell septation regulator SpoVG
MGQSYNTQRFYSAAITRCGGLSKDTPVNAHPGSVVKITSVKIRTPDEAHRGGILAFCSVTYDDEITIHDIKLMAGSKGSFIIMPQKWPKMVCQKCGQHMDIVANYCSKCGNELEKPGDRGKSMSIVHPVTQDARDVLQGAIVAEYDRFAVNRGQ